jgi:hypothetical protein
MPPMLAQIIWVMLWPLSHIFYAPKDVGIDLKSLTWKRVSILLAIVVLLQVGLYFLLKDALPVLPQ